MSLKKQSLWSMMPLLVVTVVNILSVPFFYRSLGPEMYALWFYVLTFTGAFGFMDLGLGVAVGRYMGIALGKGDQTAVREYWGTGNAIAIPLLLTMAIAFGIVGVTCGPQWFKVAPAHAQMLKWSFISGGVGLFFSYYGQFWLILSQTHLDFRFLAVLRTTVNLLQVLPSILLARLTGSPLILITWATIVAMLQLGAFIIHARRRYGFGMFLNSARRARAEEMAGYTGKTFLSILVGTFLGATDRLIVGRLASAGDFANYSVACNAGSRIQGLSAAMMGPVFSNTNRAVGSSTSVADVYNAGFDFAFPWYALVTIWVALWHPVLLRLWLGPELGVQLEGIFPPIVAAYCLTSIANISATQLGSLNRVGNLLLFTLLGIGLLAPGIYFGWKWLGMYGVALAFLFSRAAFVAQDIFTIRFIRAGGWLARKTWLHLAAQLATGVAFSSVYSILDRYSYWNLAFALLHGLLVAVWLLRVPLGRLYGSAFVRPQSNPA